MGVIYHRPSRGRPVYLGLRLGIWDVQGAIPRAWCTRCGAEVFLRGFERCLRCEKEEQKNVSKELCQPL